MRWARRRFMRFASPALPLAALIVSRLGGRRFMPEATPGHRLGARRRRRALRALAAGGAGRDLAGSVRGAAGRRHGAAAGLCPRHSACRPDRAGLSAKRARRRRLCRRLLPHPPPDRGPGRRQDVRRRGGVRRRHHRLRSFHLVSAVAAGAVRAGRQRHGERQYPLLADPAGDAGCDARAASRRSTCCSSAPRTNWASSNPAPPRPCSAPCRPWCWAASARLLVVAVWAKLFPPLRTVDKFTDVAVVRPES